jgi:surface antigen
MVYHPFIDRVTNQECREDTRDKLVGVGKSMERGGSCRADR